MNSNIEQQKRLVRISHLVTKRDDLMDSIRHYHGLSNAFGFRVTATERTSRTINRTEWVLASLSPVGLLMKSLVKILESARNANYTSPRSKRLVLAVEAMVFWGKVAFDVASTGTVVGFFKTSGALMLKALELQNRSDEEVFRLVMDGFYQAALEFEAEARFLVYELTREINRMKV